MVRFHKEAELTPAQADQLEKLDFPISKKTKFMAIVKASGYGSDATEIAKCLEKNKVDYLSVAYLSEAIHHLLILPYYAITLYIIIALVECAGKYIKKN